MPLDLKAAEWLNEIGQHIEKKTAIRHFANKWSTSARVDFYLLERHTRACSLVWLRPRSTCTPIQQKFSSDPGRNPGQN